MANVVNFNDDKNKDQSQLQSSGQSATITPVASFNQQQSVPQAAPNKPASSGQFTNIQKYLQANQGAGQQVAGGVKKQLDKSLAPAKQQQEQQAQAVNQKVQEANSTLGRGQNYLQQMQQPAQQAVGLLNAQPAVAPSYMTAQNSQTVNTQGFANGGVMTADQAMAATGQGPIQPVNAQQNTPQQNTFNAANFAADQNQLADYTKLRLGQGVDETALRNAAEQSQSLAGLTQQQAQDLASRAATAQGRSSLVGQTFNRPNYTQGQQRLDSLFLTGAGKQGIGEVKQKAQQNLGQANDLFNQAKQSVDTAGQIGTQENTLQQALQKRANELEQSYIDQLKAQVGGINDRRTVEQQNASNFFNTLVGKGQNGQTLDQNLFNELGLRVGENTFNVLNDPNLTKEQVFRFSQQQAKEAQDAATQQDVDYFKNLALLSKGNLDENGNFVAPTQDQIQLSRASQLDKAVEGLQGDNSLRNKLDTAQANFITNALKTAITGYGEDRGTSNIFGSGGTAGASASMNLADFLNSQQSQQFKSMIQNNPNLIEKVLNQINSIPRASNSTPAQKYLNLISGGGLDSVIDQAINHVGNISSIGQSSGSSAAANQRAQMDMTSKIYDSLINQGYGNYLTASGNKNIDNLLTSLKNSDVLKSEMQNRSEFNILNPENKSNYMDTYIKSNLSGNQAQNNRDMQAYNSGILNSGLTEQGLKDLQRNDYKAYEALSKQYGVDPLTALSRASVVQDAVNGAESTYSGKVDSWRNTYNNLMNDRSGERSNILSQIRDTLGLQDWNIGGIANKYTDPKLPKGK